MERLNSSTYTDGRRLLRSREGGVFRPLLLGVTARLWKSDLWDRAENLDDSWSIKVFDSHGGEVFRPPSSCTFRAWGGTQLVDIFTAKMALEWSLNERRWQRACQWCEIGIKLVVEEEEEKSRRLWREDERQELNWATKLVELHVPSHIERGNRFTWFWEQSGLGS